jgi:replicative DNA helicase
MSEAKELTYRVVRLSDLIPDLVSENEKALEARRTGKKPGPVTQLKAIDDALGGCLSPGIHILQAGPGAGKTALALQIAATCGYPALYVTAEMPMLELFRRTIARTTGTFLGKLKNGELSSEEIERLARKAAALAPWLAIMDATLGPISPEAITTRAQVLQERAEAKNVLIVLDSLQYWAGNVRGVTEYDAISAGIHNLGEIAAQLSCPIIAISHRNRTANKSENGGMYGSKGSGTIEYSAESILDLNRKDPKPDASGKVTVNLEIHKNRHGEQGYSIELEFTGRLQQFTEKGSKR